MRLTRDHIEFINLFYTTMVKDIHRASDVSIKLSIDTGFVFQKGVSGWTKYARLGLHLAGLWTILGVKGYFLRAV